MLFASRGLLFVLLFAFWIYCVIDVIATDAAVIRNLPKMAWLFLVILLPEVGSVAWLLLGRPEGVGFAPGSTAYRRPRRALGPDDSPDYLRRVDEQIRGGPSPDLDQVQWLEAREEALRRREEEIRRREEELRRREEDGPPEGM